MDDLNNINIGNTVENLFTKLVVICIILFVVLPVLIFYCKFKINKWYNKQKRLRNKNTGNLKFKANSKGNQCDIGGVNDSKSSRNNGDVKYTTKIIDDVDYIRVRDKFNSLIKNKELPRDNILAFKSYLNKLLGKYKLHYTGFHFNNDCHEIYVKIKNSHLDSDMYNNLYDYLEKLKQTKE